MTKRIKSITFALIALLLSMMLLIAGTYALFSDSATMKTHLQAGTLDAQLLRKGYTTQTLDSRGYLQTETHTDSPYLDVSALPADPTASDYVNVFGMDLSDRIAPTATMSADMQIKNNGSVAFIYEIEIVAVTGAGADLLDQLALSITIGGKTHKVDAGVLVLKGTPDSQGRVSADWHVAAGTAKDFTVTVSFADLANNNDAQDQTVVFDLIVRAVQATKGPSA
jgi:predicted ribosomally synthesized peptide with SipW-like signal peptide